MSANNDTLPTASRVSDPGIRALYRLENRWQAWLDVEAALAHAQAKLGIIPAEAAEAIAAKAKLKLMDRARIDEGFKRTGHTLVPLVWELSRVVGEPHGGWVHWGATTQNITQTGDLLVLRQAHAIFLRQIGEVLSAMADLAERTCHCESGAFHLEIDGRVAVRGLDARVSEPVADRHEVDASLEKMNGRGVSQHVRMDALAVECRDYRRGRARVLPE